MNDNEIIKALECCGILGIHHCDNFCPMFYNGTGSPSACRRELHIDAINLIKRQQAEIERLHSEVKEKTETIVFLKDQAIGWSIDFCNLKAKLNTAKSEAIKEFAERLKDMMFNYYECVNESANGRPYKGDTLMDYEVVDMIEDCIDNLVKEMTEKMK